jgi:putative nucleotidyltransferase with HDIG domain
MGIRFRLVLLVLLLVVVSTFSVSFIVMRIMDTVLMESLATRGSSVTHAIAIPAGYSLLTNDRLAMDNLVAQAQRSQSGLSYLAILDLDQNVLAHNELDKVGSSFTFLPGEPLQPASEITIVKGLYKGMESFEFRRPIHFAGQYIGNVVLGISAQQLIASKASAHKKIITVAVLVSLVAFFGAMMISLKFTTPIARLAEGFTRLQKDEQFEDIPVRSRNELGILTQNFNELVRTIKQQKESLQSYAADLESSYNDIVRILAAALDARDNYTYGHSARVAQLATEVGKKLALSREDLKELELACLLHDIGKIHVPDAVLNKQDKLSHEEYMEITKHPVQGSQILELAPSLRKYIPAVKHHHERYDGTGYPDQLSGDEVPLQAQILALADTYDAMTTSRPYRMGLSHEKAVEEIRRCSGQQFNPELVDVFVDIAPYLPKEPREDLWSSEASCVS